MLAHIRTHTHTHPHTRTRTNTHTHTPTHTYPHIYLPYTYIYICHIFSRQYPLYISHIYTMCIAYFPHMHFPHMHFPHMHFPHIHFPLTQLPYTYYHNYYLDYLFILKNVLFIIVILLYFVNNTYTHLRTL